MALRDLDKSSLNMVPDEIMMESDTVLVQYIIKSWKLQNKNPGMISISTVAANYFICRQWDCGTGACPRPQAEDHQWAADHLSPQCAHTGNRLCNKFLQTLLLWIHNIYKSDISASPYNSVHLCLPIPPTNSLCENDRCLAHIFPTNSVCRGNNLEQRNKFLCYNIF